jgi:hypothetical protein
MEYATFRKWLTEHGCRFDTQSEKRGEGHGTVTIHRATDAQTTNDDLRGAAYHEAATASKKLICAVTVQFAEATSSYSTRAVCCCAHSEQLNVSRSRPGVPVCLIVYSHIARPQLGHGG